MAPHSRKLTLCFLLLLCACAPRKEVYYEPLADGRMVRYKEIGVASWYGKEYHGRQTANGEIYDMFAMTAAHLTLPFNTVVRVTNLENGKKVELTFPTAGPGPLT
jgi:rare lipoprotein A